MACLNIDLNYFDHPKTTALVDLLGRGAELLPLKLWAYCGRFHAKSGRITNLSPEKIEAKLGWWGKPGKAIEAMVDAGFVREVNGAYEAHDWLEHQGHIAAFNLRAKQAAQARWEKIGYEDASSIASSNAPSNALTIPTKPTNKKPLVASPPKEVSAPSPDTKPFLEWWAAEYGRRFGSPYHVLWAKEGGIVKALLKTFDVETLKGLAVRFFDQNDEFLDKTGRTVGVFSMQINKLNSKKEKTGINAYVRD